MERNVGNIDGLTRAIGGAPLLIGATLALPGVDARTLETFMLWVALTIGGAALVAACTGRCSWYAGVFITGAAMATLSLRFAPYLAVQAAVAVVGIAIGVYALFTRATSRCQFNAFFRIPLQ